MATVVEAFLRCISDETLVGATLLCLADGIEEADRYQARRMLLWTRNIKM